MTRRGLLTAVVVGALVGLSGCAEHGVNPVAIAPPGSPYQKVSLLFPPFPSYLHGLGTLYVDPETVPAGPYLAYDRQGHLVASMYMIPIRDMAAHEPFKDLHAPPGMTPQRIELYYNDAHPGVIEPHYHIVFWYVPPAQEPQ